MSRLQLSTFNIYTRLQLAIRLQLANSYYSPQLAKPCADLQLAIYNRFYISEV